MLNALNTPSFWEAVSLCRGIGSSLPWTTGWRYSESTWLVGLGASWENMDIEKTCGRLFFSPNNIWLEVLTSSFSGWGNADSLDSVWGSSRIWRPWMFRGRRLRFGNSQLLGGVVTQKFAQNASKKKQSSCSWNRNIPLTESPPMCGNTQHLGFFSSLVSHPFVVNRDAIVTCLHS